MKSDGYIDWKLLMRRMNRGLSREEEGMFEAWVKADPAREKYYKRMTDVWNGDVVHETNMLKVLQNLDVFLDKQREYHCQRLLRRWRRWSVAAAVVMIGVMSLFVLQQDDKRESLVPLVAAAGENNVILVLHDGTSVDLNKVTDSTHVFVGGAEIKREEGTILFGCDKSSRETEYNTIITPMGGEYHVVLSDGSQIWLSSNSRVKFPVNFEGDERRVFLSGEAYFEVQHNEKVSFIVETDLGNVKVYGTQFNVRRYENEERIRTTLVDGSVGFARKGGEDYIKIDPGYQVSYEEGQEPVVQKVKVRNVIAWKNKQFSFEHQTLEEIMKDVARWYDVNITFSEESLKSLYFSGTLNRFDSIETLLRFFEEGCDIRFNVDGKKVVVIKKVRV